jgi:hypothetical protein
MNQGRCINLESERCHKTGIRKVYRNVCRNQEGAEFKEVQNRNTCTVHVLLHIRRLLTTALSDKLSSISSSEQFYILSNDIPSKDCFMQPTVNVVFA